MIALRFLSSPLQAAVLLSLSAMLAITVLAVARRGLLSMRYTLGWVFVAFCIAVGGSLGGLIEPIADTLNVSSGVLAAGVAATMLLVITVQLSISVSGLTEANRSLVEALALAEARNRADHEELERRAASTSSGIQPQQDGQDHSEVPRDIVAE
jgi:hypothetical protein